jgi:hypothetical protein
MESAPVTLEDLYPKHSVQPKPQKARQPWYMDVKVIKQKRLFRWTVEERALLYDLRIVKGKSITEIQKLFRKKNNITSYLGPDDPSDKFSRTRLHNQIRMVRSAFAGLCHKCREPLTEDDLKRLNAKDREDPSMGLCSKCSSEVSEYKKDRRAKALELGLCPICLSAKVIKGHTMCKGCLSASHRRRYIQGLCGKCGEKPLSKNSIALCDDCLEENRKNSREYRQKKQTQTA